MVVIVSIIVNVAGVMIVIVITSSSLTNDTLFFVFSCCLPSIPDSEGMKNDEERKRYLTDLLAERIKSSTKAKRQECKKTLEGMGNRLYGLFSILSCETFSLCIERFSNI